MAELFESPPDFEEYQNEFSIQIGNKLIPFFDVFAFISSYRDERANTDAMGPYWASIIGTTPQHIRIHFFGYGDNFDVFIHKADLPELDYKFQLKGSPIYKNLDKKRQETKMVLEAVEGYKISDDESYGEHNNNLFATYWKKEGSLTDDYKLSPEIINRLTVYQEWNSPTSPFFVESKGSGVLHPDMAIHKPTGKRNATAVGGSRGQWQVVDVRGDGNCMFRAVANGIHFDDTGERWEYDNDDQNILQKKLRQEAVAWLCNPANQNLPFETLVDPDGRVHIISVKRQIIDSAVENGFISRKREPLENAPKKEFAEYDDWAEEAIKSYCKEKGKDGNMGRNYWGTDLELLALSNIYGVGINVYHRQAKESVTGSYDNYKRRFSPEQGPLHGEVNIYWKGLNHYNVLYPNRT